jgi:hypothetical protein
MPLTRDFKETIQSRALRDLEFRAGLLQEGIDCLLAGDLETGELLLQDYFHVTQFTVVSVALPTDTPHNHSH